MNIFNLLYLSLSIVIILYNAFFTRLKPDVTCDVEEIVDFCKGVVRTNYTSIKYMRSRFSKIRIRLQLEIHIRYKMT